LGHQRTAQFDVVASVDRLLPIQRQAIGILVMAIWARSALVGMPLSMIWAAPAASAIAFLAEALLCSRWGDLATSKQLLQFTRDGRCHSRFRVVTVLKEAG
jgi:hypothetical protein